MEPGADADLERILAEEPPGTRPGAAMRALHLAGPFAAIAAAAALLWLAGSLARVAKAAAASFFALGKLIVVFGAAKDATFRLSAFELAAMVVFMDTVYGWFIGFNLHYVYRVRRLGPSLKRITNFCRYFLSSRPWMRRWALTGVTLFVMFPLTGTGAPGAAVLGRLVGLRASATLAAIFLGSVLGCGLMAAFATPFEPFFERVQHETWFRILGVALIGAILLALYRLGRRLSREAEEYAKTGGSP